GEPPRTDGQLPTPTTQQMRSAIKGYVKARAKEGRAPNQDEAVHLVQGEYRISRKNSRALFRGDGSRRKPSRSAQALNSAIYRRIICRNQNVLLNRRKIP